MRIGLGCMLLGCCLASSAQSAPARHSFTVEGKQFLYDGKPYRVLSGEMHYPRIPREYWRDRFRKARAMGLNTITTYVFWNVHEPRPGAYDFSGQNDVAEYIREAQQEGLNVILRPGPYVCAEWELGGYPSWLLKDRELVLRSADPKYMAAMRTWFGRLAQEIKPLLLANGGPIIAIQVENEYGSFGDDHAYMEGVKQALIDSGMTGVLYTADGPSVIPKGGLPELPAVINFGTGDAKSSFAELDKLRPDGPRMSGEYWAGWFDHWGDKHSVTDGQKQAEEYAWMIGQGYSVSMYMFDGGTSFGWMNGANSNGTNYEPDTTSYDYDAPIDERGAPRAKFFAFRDAIAKVTGKVAPPLPAPLPRRAFPVEKPKLTASLWRNLPIPLDVRLEGKGAKPLPTMEDLDQSYGYLLYRTGLDAGDGGELVLDGLHDYAQVYLDQTLVGTLDRRIGTTHLTLPVLKAAATLDILVENSGRVNYTKVLRGERKGLTGKVTVGGKEPKRWEVFSLPMDDLAKLRFAPEPCEGPCFYRTSLKAATPTDTYLDTSAVAKGEVWVNGRALGRAWSVGPQFALYTPAPWLHKGLNDVVWFDLQGSAQDRVTSVAEPIFDKPSAKEGK